MSENITPAERERCAAIIADYEAEQRQQREKEREAAKEKENKKPTQPIKEKPLTTTHHHSPPPTQPRPIQRQHPVQQHPIQLLPWELAQPAPQEKKKEPISIFGPPIPKIPIPRGRGLK